MNKRYIVLLIAFTLSGIMAQAQIKQADKLYESYSYSAAIPYYLKVAQKPNDPDCNYAIIKLADCYRLANDQLNAKGWYAKAVKLPNSEDINWFYYGEALRCAQEYDLAREAYEKYYLLNPADSRGKEYAEFCKGIDKLNEIPVGFEVKNVTVLNSDRSDFGTAFYKDGIVFVSDRRRNFMDNKKYEWTDFNYLDLYFATPRYLNEFFQDMNEPKLFDSKFNQTYHDGPAAFARHDSLIYLTRTEKGKEKKDADKFRTNRIKIFWSKYNGSWSETKPFIYNSDDFSVGHPALSTGGDTLYFISNMPGGKGGTDLYFCLWENEKWGSPVSLGPEVNSVGDEMFPSINGNTLYFASNGFAGFGGLDLFKSTLAGGKWSKPENLGMPINSSFDDFALVIDPKSKKGFFSSNRPGGKGSDDIYACKVVTSKPLKSPCPEVLQDTMLTEITGFIKDSQTLKPLPGSKIFVLNTKTDKVEVLKADANGMFKTRIHKGIFYVAKGMENQYLSDCINFRFETGDTSHFLTTPRDLLLEHLQVNQIFPVNNMDYSIQTIYYDFNKWFIRPDAEIELDKVIRVMKENAVTVEFGSHTDSRGTKEYNVDLSQKRAESAVRYIVMHGIEQARISAKGYGESQLVNGCTDGVPCTPAEQQANRRTEIKITGFTKPETHEGYDVSKFKGDEEIPLYLFDRDFFVKCLQPDRVAKRAEIQGGTSNIAPKETPVQAIVSTPYIEEKKVEAATEVKVKEPVKKPMPAKKSGIVVTPDPAGEPEKVKEPDPTVVPVINCSGNLTYRVQIFALANEKSLIDPEFEDLLDVQMYIEDGMYKYTCGIFKTHEEAINYRSRVIQNGFDDAFVVTFCNSKRIYISPSF